MAARLAAPWRRIGLFGASAALSGIVSLAAIPLLVSAVGAHDWAAMITGQSIGQSLAVLAIFGWGLTGPAMIARALPADRPGLFLDSLIARTVLLAPLLVVQAIITLAIVPTVKGPAFVAGVAMILAGVSANWYFTGEARSDRFFLLDSVPRIAGTVIGTGLTMVTHDLWAFALSQFAGAVVALAVSCAAIFRGAGVELRPALEPRRVWRSLADQRDGIVATGLSAMAMPGVLAIVAATAPMALPMFVFADRVARFLGIVSWPITQYFQGWVPAARGTELRRRLWWSGRVAAVIALAFGILDAALLPLAAEVASHGEIVIDPVSAVAFGAAAVGGMFAPWLTLIGLVTVGRVRVVAQAAVIGVPLQLVAVLVAALLASPPIVAVVLTLAWLGPIAGMLVVLVRTPLPRDAEESTATAPVLVV